MLEAKSNLNDTVPTLSLSFFLLSNIGITTTIQLTHSLNWVGLDLEVGHPTTTKAMTKHSINPNKVTF